MAVVSNTFKISHKKYVLFSFPTMFTIMFFFISFRFFGFQLGKVTFVEKDESAVNKKDKYAKAEQETSEEAPKTRDTSPDSPKPEEIQAKAEEPKKEDQKKESPTQEAQNQEIMSSVLATMWMGDECGNIYVHSSVANWAQCLHTVKMKDAVIAIV